MKHHSLKQWLALSLLPVALVVVAASPTSDSTTTAPQISLSFEDGPYLIDFEGRFEARLLVSGAARPGQKWTVTLRGVGLGSDVSITPSKFPVRLDGDSFKKRVVVTGILRNRMQPAEFSIHALLMPREGRGAGAKLDERVPALPEVFTLQVAETGWLTGWGFWMSDLLVHFAMDPAKARIPHEQLALHLELGYCNTSGVLIPDLIEGQAFVLQSINGVGLYDLDPPGHQRCWVEYRIHLHDPLRDAPLQGCACVMRKHIFPSRSGSIR
jgi:hypothetical protein